jgi:hypothetical protein
LILDVRLPEDFSPGRHRTAAGALPACGRSPCLMSRVRLLGPRRLANIEVRTRAAYFNREYVNWRLLYHCLIACVPFTTTPGGLALRRPHAADRRRGLRRALNFAGPMIQGVANGRRALD